MAEISSKELIRGLFQLRELPRTPFIPWISTFAAQLEQVRVEDMLSDAGLLSASLLNAQKLFGYDVITVAFDPTLEAEACGCQIEWSEEGSLPKVVSHPLLQGASLEEMEGQDIGRMGRIPVVLDAIKRINIIKGKQIAVFGLLTGPLTLALHLKGETLRDELNAGSEEAARVVAAAASIGLKLGRKFCELGVDAIVVADQMLATVDANVYATIAGPVRSIWNVAKFYNAHSLILTTGCKEEKVEPILGLQAEGVALGRGIERHQLAEAAVKRRACYGTSVELSGERIESGRRESDNANNDVKGHFLTTDWEVPYETDVNAMHRLMASIKDYH
jgi:uroporphyrinogen-III decarboxylase